MSQRQRISTLSAASLITVALLLDLLSLIPVVNILVDFLAMVIFGLWFYLLGIGFISPKLFGAAFIGFVVELIPFLSILPGLTVAVIATILIVKSEDRLKNVAH